MTQERKKRYGMELSVAYDDGQKFMTGPVVDISETGLFIETVMPLSPGARVKITPLIEDEAGIFEFDGEVVRKNEYDLDEHFDRVPGMGIRFVEPDPEQIENLRAQFRKLEADDDAGKRPSDDDRLSGDDRPSDDDASP